MNDYREDFSNLEKKVWLNAASEGPLPIVAQQALLESIEWKSKPYMLTDSKFISTVTDLKKSIGTLINVNPVDVILANSASYGLHILANGVPWQKGDEILVMFNDFPTDILPWLALEEKGVVIRQVKPKDKVLTPAELQQNITQKTKLFCITHVHTFSGYILDVKQFGEICQKHGVIFVLNLSQSLGTMPVDISSLSVDAVVTAGYKWLCGPYGSGFCWLKPSLRDRLQYNQAYWVAAMTKEDLEKETLLRLTEIKSARKYDVFGTANFFNFVPFRAAIDYWLGLGLDTVRNHHQTLIDQFIDGLSQQNPLP